MKIFEPKLISSLKGYTAKQLTSDIVAGIIVAIIALPLSIALAIASGVNPENGLITAIVAGFVIALLGGSRVNISGPTAAFATIVAGIAATSGFGGLVIATLMAGVILILMGLLKFGALIKYIPHTITTGFTSGIALTIVIGQIKDFMGIDFKGASPIEAPEKLLCVFENITTVNWWSLLVGAIGLLILIVWPKISKKIPGSLIAVVVGTALVKLLQLDGEGFGVATIGSSFGTLSASFSFPNFAGVDFEMIMALLPSAFTIAILAAIESLLSCVVSDGMIKDRHNSNTELIAQGAGNICSALLGGIPATGAIARTAANVKNGGRSPIAGIVHALVLLLIFLVLMPYAAWIPMPIIAAILFMVAYNMCEWRGFVKICKTAPKSDILVLVVTFALTVIFDLVVAIAVGLILAVVLFMKRMGDVTHIRAWNDEEFLASHDHTKLKDIPDRTAVFEIEGPMFFASADKFSELPLKDDVRVMILRMRDVPALDASGMKNLFAIFDVCREKNIILLLSHANEQPFRVMNKAGFVEAVGREHFLPNIDEALVYAERIVNEEAVKE
ncbi:MAG: STAS domain-containing protein [Ruminococcaceae bacterium]|nr:STAS domain-containing protein [Oscillospiraceae bacterium]